MQQAEISSSQKLTFFHWVLLFTGKANYLYSSFHYCSAKVACSHGAYILTELFRGGITLIYILYMARLQLRSWRIQLSDLPNSTWTSLPQWGPELGSLKLVYMEKSATGRAFFSDKYTSEST